MSRAVGTPSIVNLDPETLRNDLAKVNASTTRVLWDKPLNDCDLAEIGRALSRFPRIVICASSNHEQPQNLEFLRFFPTTLSVRIACLRLKNLAGLEHLSPRLESLSLGLTLKKAMSLEPVRRFVALRRLEIEGHRDIQRHFDCFQSLEWLYVRSVTMPDFAPLSPLRKLWWLWFGLGGTKSLRGLDRLNHLQYLELWKIKGLSDLSPISQARALEEIKLESLSRVVQLPSLQKLKVLRRLELINMNGLRSLAPLRLCRYLRELCVWEGKHHQPDDFACLIDHPSLQRVAVSLGSRRKDEAVREMLDLDEKLPGLSFARERFA